MKKLVTPPQPNIHIHASQNAKVKIFLIDAKGKHIKWTGVKTSRLRGSRVTFAKCNNGFAIEIWGRELASCREELCNTLYHFMRNITLPMGTKVTLDPPRTKSGRSIVRDLSSFSLEIGGSKDGKYKLYWDPTRLESMVDAYKRGYLLTTDSASRAEVYGLMDVLVGTGALLMGGPGSYIRPLRGKNKLNCGTKESTRQYTITNYMAARGINGSAAGRTTRNSHTTDVARGMLKYTGISNFWLAHPAQFSVVTGLLRTAMDIWFDGLYDEINDEIGVDGCRRWLTEMSKKEKHTAADKKELVELLSWFKPYLFSKKMDENPGGYPVNKYTYDMFLRFSKMSYPMEFMSTWASKGSPYGMGTYGFVQWCRAELGAKDSLTLRRTINNGNWGGLMGQRISFGGH